VMNWVIQQDLLRTRKNKKLQWNTHKVLSRFSNTIKLTVEALQEKKRPSCAKKCCILFRKLIIDWLGTAQTDIQIKKLA